MEEIQVGEYIRTKKGIIVKVDAIYEYGKRKKYKRYFTKKNEEFNEGTLIKEHLIYDTRQKYIPKHSKNILDLIEVGDIVELDGEKYQVIYDKSYNKLGILIPNKDYLAIRHTSLEYIFQKNKKVTILTHEQFEENSFRIGE